MKKIIFILLVFALFQINAEEPERTLSAQNVAIECIDGEYVHIAEYSGDFSVVSILTGIDRGFQIIMQEETPIEYSLGVEFYGDDCFDQRIVHTYPWGEVVSTADSQTIRILR